MFEINIVLNMYIYIYICKMISMVIVSIYADRIFLKNISEHMINIWYENMNIFTPKDIL